jgi:hypothetical protein
MDADWGVVKERLDELAGGVFYGRGGTIAA